MRNLLSAILIGLFLAPAAAFAIPVTYDLTFTADTGPDGTGSLVFDADTNTMTDFEWNFGAGLVGGLADSAFITNAFGDTRGSFFFEMITGIDAHAGVDCSNTSCGTGDNIAGAAPGGATQFGLSGFNGTGAIYRFGGGDSAATGLLTLSEATDVPAPASLALLGLGLAGLGFRRRLQQ